MQTTARRNDWPLDKMVLVTEVTKKLPEQLDGQSRDGAFIHGLTLEGARWDEKAGVLEESRPKELFYQMPVCPYHHCMVIADGGNSQSALVWKWRTMGYACRSYSSELFLLKTS